MPIHNSCLPLASPEEPKEGVRFEANATFDDMYGILVELDDTFSNEYSLEEPYVVGCRGVHLLWSLLIPFVLSLPLT